MAERASQKKLSTKMCTNYPQNPHRSLTAFARCDTIFSSEYAQGTAFYAFVAPIRSHEAMQGRTQTARLCVARRPCSDRAAFAPDEGTAASVRRLRASARARYDRSSTAPVLCGRKKPARLQICSQPRQSPDDPQGRNPNFEVNHGSRRRFVCSLHRGIRDPVRYPAYSTSSVFRHR